MGRGALTRAGLVAGALLLTGCATAPEDARVAGPPPVADGCVAQGSMRLVIEGEWHGLCLVDRGDARLLVFRNEATGASAEAPLSPGYAVGLLGDRRLEPLWPAIEQWGGPGMARQRDRALNALVVGNLESTSADALDADDPDAGPVANIYALRSIGRFDDAHALLDRVEAALPSDTVVALRSDLMKTAGRKDEAIALLQDYLAAPDRTEPEKLRALLNLAELLVEEGRLGKALVALDRLDDEHGVKIDWLTACALHQRRMARGDDMTAARPDPLRRRLRARWLRDEEPDEGEAHVASDYFRYALCIGDGEALASIIARDHATGRVPSMASTLFQPRYRPLDPDHAKAISGAREDPEIAYIRADVRPLGPESDAAVNGWRSSRD